jgi:hypothetical protein
MNSRWHWKVVISVLLVSVSVSLGADGSGAFATGTYRNLFVEAGHSEQEVKASPSYAVVGIFEEFSRLNHCF